MVSLGGPGYRVLSVSGTGKEEVQCTECFPRDSCVEALSPNVMPLRAGALADDVVMMVEPLGNGLESLSGPPELSAVLCQGTAGRCHL